MGLSNGLARLSAKKRFCRGAIPSPACWGRWPGGPDGVWPAASNPGGLRNHKSEPSTMRSCFPHPIRRASPDTFPTSWRRGRNRGPDGVWPAASNPGGLRNHKSEPSTTRSCFPHPIRRASPDTFPTSWRRGARNRLMCACRRSTTAVRGGAEPAHAPNARAAKAIIVRNAPSEMSSAKSRSVSTAALCITASMITIRT